MPSAPNLSRILFGYEPDAFMIGLLIIAVALYINGVIVLTKRGDKWPIGRTISFAIGISAVDFATSGGLGLYAHFSFSWHMVAHMTLGMIELCHKVEIQKNVVCAGHCSQRCIHGTHQ
jgi:putative copper resistance protein D